MNKGGDMQKKLHEIIIQKNLRLVSAMLKISSMIESFNCTKGQAETIAGYIENFIKEAGIRNTELGKELHELKLKFDNIKD